MCSASLSRPRPSRSRPPSALRYWRSASGEPHLWARGTSRSWKEKRRSASTPDGARRSAERCSDYGLFAQPDVDLGLVGRDPLLCSLVRVHVIPGDHLRDSVLVGVRPAEALHHADGGRAARGELLAHELQERVARICTRVLLRVAALLLVVETALEPRGQLDTRELVRRVQI